MIEGLRAFPHYQDARKAGTAIGSNGCEECMRTIPRETRQQLGCGWEQSAAGARPWSPQSWGARGLSTTTCAGYSTRLHATVEIVDAYCHWENGTLVDYLDGERPTRGALDCLAVFRAGLNEYDADRYAKGGA